MQTYKIKINGKEVEKWSHENGVTGSDRWASDVKVSKLVQTDSLTRKDVLKAVTYMLFHTGRVTEEDLFDGNEDYFIFSRLEDNDGNELEVGRDGYNATYFIDVEKIEQIKAVSIQ